MTISLLVVATALGTMACVHHRVDRAGELALLPGRHEGDAVDIGPWCYEFRADRKIQPQPEASFIPRRLDRLEGVYRAASVSVPKDDLKSIAYDMPDMLKTFPPKPKGQLKAGLLWTGGLVDYRVELHWPGDPPPVDSIEVRSYPTSFGWFGWTVDKVLTDPEMSADRRTWIYRSDPSEKMDSSYNNRVPAAAEMVAVFGPENPSSIPSLRIVGPDLGKWKRSDIEIEWGYGASATVGEFAASLEPYVAQVKAIKPLDGDSGTTVTGLTLRSSPSISDRRGVAVSLLYAPDIRPGLDSRLTVRSKMGESFTFSLKDLDRGPMLIPRLGIFVVRAGSGMTARQFANGLSAAKGKGLREMVRDHPEASSWEQVMHEVRLWTCPKGTTLKVMPDLPIPPMEVKVPDPGWEGAWRAVTNQLRGKNMWGSLAFEVGRVAHEMDMIGLHQEADRIYEHFLSAPGAKSDGDYSDGKGALEWATAIKHDMGYSHDGTHASTGRLLFAMAERYFLTGDRAWFVRNRTRLQAAADWIVRQRTGYLANLPNRKDLFVAGLMPPQMLGDYAMPACDWHWYYVDNALSLQGLQRFADALSEVDPAEGKRYKREATSFRRDLRRAIEREAALAPVRLGQDGAYHSYLPRMAYSRGLTGPEIGAPQFPDCDKFMGPLPLSEPFGAIAATDPRMVETIEDMAEMGTSHEAIRKDEASRAEKGAPVDDAWFWNCFVILPKASHNANIYLLQDDVPSFLRFWMNAYASVVGADGKLWEHWHLGNFDDCAAPDNGTAGWFMENYRDLLVMEKGPDLCLAFATPRTWLEQGKEIAVRGAPTYFGELAYSIKSDVLNGSIAVRIAVPSRDPAKSVYLRLRHPKSLPIKSVTVNGKAWHDFDHGKETIRLRGVHGEVTVVARF
ncbi:MAG: hypothetical protein P4L46_26020 [Fimbriimonas sp.]|nr:hypothetical protein [Fimbriimonas sp.]